VNLAVMGSKPIGHPIFIFLLFKDLFMDYGCSKEISQDDPRQPRWAEQRKERGFDDTETWNLDCAIIQFILPRLERFKEISCGHPAYMTEERWDEILQKIIDGFKTYDSILSGSSEQFDEAWQLFTNHFWNLWD
jgi:hypothetical protein